MKEGTVFVGEDFDDEMFMWPGRFSVHWESPDNKQFREGPQGLSAQDAIEWARTQADVVYIRPGDSDVYYSAGVRNPDKAPVWPEGTDVPRRREPGREYLDRTADDPPIDWQIRLSHDLPAGDVLRFAERFRAAVEADPSAQEATSSVGPGQDGQCAAFEFVVQASTQAEAQQLADAVHERAHTAAWPALGEMPAGHTWSSMDHVRPVDWDPVG